MVSYSHPPAMANHASLLAPVRVSSLIRPVAIEGKLVKWKERLLKRHDAVRLVVTQVSGE